MRLNFRQGLVEHQSNQFIRVNGTNIELRMDDRPIRVTVAHRDTNYIHVEDATIPNAWIGPFDPALTYWLYWDFSQLDFTRTFGYTTLEPVAQATTPAGNDVNGTPYATEGRMWFNTTTNVQKEYSNGMWREVLRVFAAKLLTGNTFDSLSINAPLFTGTQIGNTNSNLAGRVLFTDLGAVIKRDNKTFLTTETSMFTSAARSDGIRLESNISHAICADPALAKFTVVAFSEMGKIRSAKYEDTTNTVIAMVTDNLLAGEVGNITLQGVVTSEDWAFTTVGQSLWVDNGMLTPNDPHIADSVAHPHPHVPVARVLTVDSIIFEQGLGGRGEQGPESTAVLALTPASTTVLGGVTFVTAPSTVADAKAISDTDPRLTDARTPLTHQHTATEVTFTSPTLTGANVNEAIHNLKTTFDGHGHSADDTTFTSTLIQGSTVTQALHSLNTAITNIAPTAAPVIYATYAALPPAADHKGVTALLDDQHVMIFSTGVEWRKLSDMDLTSLLSAFVLSYTSGEPAGDIVFTFTHPAELNPGHSLGEISHDVIINDNDTTESPTSALSADGLTLTITTTLQHQGNEGDSSQLTIPAELFRRVEDHKLSVQAQKGWEAPLDNQGGGGGMEMQ